ncbi:mucin-4-like [Triplophysa dalaica]|uniref:mucin-4-like n=1 Tax=Triplophysa dalaica TaxID=1582913 RepID=UPI0024E01CFF|nr:mucin-4-like [Triplophysa dalaica]
MQSQGSLGQYAPASHGLDSQGMSSSFSGSAQGSFSKPSPSSPTVSRFSSSSQVYSQSTSDQDLYGQLSATSQFGSHPQKGTSPQLSQAASGFTSGSFPQSQGSLGQYAPASLSKYITAPLASQGFATRSATASSRRGLTSTFLGGSQSGSSLTLQGTGSSSMPQRTTSQFVSGSPSQHSSTSLSSTQSINGQYSPASQWVFSVSQSPQREPSVSSWTQGLQSSDAALSQGNLQFQSSRVHSRFSSQLSARDSANQSNPQALSKGSGQLVSSPGSSGSYSGISLQSPSTSSRYPLGSPGYVKLGSNLDSSQSGTGQSSSLYGSNLQTGSGAQHSSSSYASLQGGSSAVVGPSSQYGSVFSPLDAKAGLYLSRPSAASLTQGIQTSKTASSRSTSSAQMSSGFSSSLSALSQNVAPVAQSGPMSAVWRSQSPSRLSSSFQAPSASTIGGQMSERFTSHNAADSSLPSSSGLSAKLSSKVFSGSSLRGVYSKTNLRWGQASHNAFAPRAVQSSQSEYPVTGSISVDEVGSSVTIDRSQKSTSRFSNPRQYVKGGFSSSHETSRTQTGSVSAALAVPQDELQKSSLTSLQPQVSYSSSFQNIASQLASGQSLQNQYSSSSHGGSGLQSAGGLSQIVSHQREGSSSGLLSSPDVPSPHTTESNVKVSSSPLMVSSQATTAQSSPILNMSSTLESSGPLLGVSGSATSFSGASTEHVSSPSEIYHQPAGDKGSLRIHALGSESSLPLQSPEAAVNVYSSESLSSSPSIVTQGSTFTSQGSPITAQVISSGPVLVTTQEVSSGSIGSPSQSISSQYSPGTLTPSKLGSLSLSVSNQSTSDQSQYMSGAPSRYAMPLASSSHYVPVQTGSSSRHLFSPKPQGTYAVYAPSSPSKNLNVAATSPQSVSFQSGSDQDFRWTVAQVGTKAAESSEFMPSQGGSSSFSGALSHPQSSGFSGSMQSLGTSSQNVPISPTFSKFGSSRLVSSQSTSDPGLYGTVPSTSQIGSWPQSGLSSQFVPSQGASSSYSGSFPQSQSSSPKYSLGHPKPNSPQTVSRQSASVKGSNGSSLDPLGAVSQLASHGMSSSFRGSALAQGTFSQPAPSSPTDSKFSSSRQVFSQSTSDQDLYGQLTTTSQFGSQPQKGTSPQLSHAASGFNSGSLMQSQGSLGQYAPASHGLDSQGMSSSFSGSAQGSFSKPAPSSPTVSKFSSSRQVYSQSTSDQNLYGQLPATSQFGSQPQKGTSPQLSQAASGFKSGHLMRSQGSLGQYAPASPSKYVNAPLASQSFASQGMSSSFSGSAQGSLSKPAPSSPTVSKFSSSRQVYSQSTSDQDLYGQLPATSQFGSQPQKGTSPQLSQAASGFNSGSLMQSQGSLGQYAPASPSKYVNAPLASQSFASQGMSSSFSGSAQGSFSKPAPSSPTVSKFSSSRQVYSQSTSDQDLYGQLPAKSQFGSQPQKGTSPQLSQAASGFKSGHLMQSQGSLGQYAPASHGLDSQGMSSSFSGSAQGSFSKPAPSSPTVSKFSSSRQVYSQSTSDQDLYGQLPATTQFGSQPQKGTSPQLSQAASGFKSGHLMQSQGSLGQYAPASHGLDSQGMSSSFSGSAQGSFSKPSPSSPTVSRFSSSRQVYSQSTSDQDLYGQLTATSQFGSQPQKGTSPQLSPAASGFNSGSLMQSQGSLGQYAPASPSKYVNAPLASQSFASQGMSSSFSGSAQGSFSKPAPSSPTVSKFSSSRQVYSQSTSDQDLYGQLSATSQFGSQPQKGTSPQLSQAASGFKSGHLMQSQGSLGQYAPASPSKYVNAPLASQSFASQGMSSSFSGSAQGSFSKPAPSSPTVSKFSSSRQVYSQSTSDQDLYGQLSATSQFGSHPQKGTSPQLSQAASGFTSGSFPQSQGSLGQYAPASLSKYITAPLASQGFATRSATASSRRGLTSTFLGGSQSGSSLTLQGTGSSSMPQRTTSQFVSGSPSQHSSTSLSSTQSINGQYSPASQWVFSVSQSPQREPSVSSWTQGLQSSDAALSQGNLQFQSSRVHSRFSSQLSARDSANQSNPQALSKGSGQLVSSPGSSGSYSGISLQSPSTSSRYPLGSPGYVKLGSNLDSSQSGTGQSSSLYGSNLQTGSGAQHSSSSYASLQGGSSAVVGPSSQYGSVFSPLDAKAGLYLSRPSAASLTQGIQTSKTASSRSTSSAQMSSGFSSSLSALSQNVAPVAQSGPMSAVWRSQSPSRLSSSFQAPSASTIGGQMSERFTSHNAADSSLPSSSGLSAKLSSKVFSGSSLRGVYSKTNLRWGQASHNAFAPRAVQSSQSEYPVTGSISVDEVGSSVTIDRSQKSTSRFSNPRQNVKGGFSSSHETSRTQTGSVSAALAVPQDELQKSSLTSLQPQVSYSSSFQNIASHLASGQSLQNQYSSSSHGGSGLQSAGGLSQIVSHQREGSSSGLLSSPDVPSPHTTESNVKVSSSPLMVSSQATTAQSSHILNMSSTLESSGPLLGVSGSATSFSGASTEHVSSPSEIYHQPAGDKGSLRIHALGSESSLPLQSPEAAVNVYSSESLSSSPSIVTQGSTFTSQGSPITAQVISSGPVLVTTQEVSSGSIGSPSQSISSQYSPGTLTPSKLGSLSLSVSNQSTSDQSQYMSGAPSRYAMPLASSSHYVPVQTGSSSRHLFSPKPQGTYAVYAPSSPSKYLNVAATSPQSVSFQSGSDQDFRWTVAQVGTKAAESSEFMPSQGGSSSFSGALSHPQSSGFSGSMQSLVTSSQNVPISPTFSKFGSSRLVSSQSTSDPGLYGTVPSTSQIGSWPQSGLSSQFVPSQGASSSYSGSFPQSQSSSPKYSLGHPKPNSPQTVSRQSASVKGSNGSSVDPLGAVSQLASHGMSSSFRGSALAQGTFSQPAPSSPTDSKFSSSRQVFSQSTSDQDLYGQLTTTSQFGSQPQKGTSPQLSQAASGFNSGSLMQSQGSLGQYAPASHGLDSQGMSSSFSGSAQGSFSKPAPSSPTVSKFSSSRQVYSQSTSDQNLYGQLPATSQFGSQPQKGTSPQLSQAASGFKSGHLMQSQGSLGQYAPASPSKYVNAPLASQSFASQGMSSSFSGSAQGSLSKPAPSSPTVSKFSSSRQVYSQSTSDQDLYGQLPATSQFGSQPQKGTSPQLSQAASGFNSGSLMQSQGSLGQYAPASPSKYVNAPLASQSFASQGMSSSFSGSAQGSFSKPAPSSPTVSKFSSTRQVYSQSTSDQDLYGQLPAKSQFGSQPQKGTSPQLSQAASGFKSGHLMQSQGSLGQYAPASHGLDSQGMSSSFSGSAQGSFSKHSPSSPTVSRFSSSRQVYSQSTSDQDLYGQLTATSQFGSQPQKGTSPQLSPAASGFNSGSLMQSQGSLGQYAPASPSNYVNAPLASQSFASQGMSSSFSGSAQGSFSKPAPSSPTVKKFSSSRQVYSQSTSDQDLYGQLSATSQFGSQPQKGTSPQLSPAASGFNSGSLMQSQGSLGQYAPASPSKYVNAPLTSQSFASQGMSSSFSGSAQGSFSKPAPSSPTVSKFSSSRQVYSQSTSDQDFYGQLPAKSQFGSQPQKGTSPQLSQAASGFKSGHLMQSQGSLGQYAPASHGLDSQGMSSSFSGSAQGSFSKPAPSSPTVSKFSSSRQVYSQSTSDQDLYGQLPATSQFGSQPQKGTSPQLSPAASGFTSGSFPQSQGTLGQYAPASPSKYVNAPLTSQSFASQGMSSSFSGSAQGSFSKPAPSSPTVSKFSSSRQVYSQSTSDQDLYGQLPAKSQFGSQPQKGTSPQLSQAASGFKSGHLMQSQGSLGQYAPASHGLDSQGMSSSFSGSAQGSFSKPAPSSPTVSRFSSSRQVYSQSTSDQDLYGQLTATSQFGSQPQKGTSPQLSPAASGFNSGSLMQSQGSLGQYAPASPSKYVNAPLASQSFASQGMSSSFSGSAQGSFSKPAPSSPTVKKFSSSRQVYSQSTSDQDLYGQLSATSQFGSQPQKGTSPQLSPAASGFNSGSLMQSQGSLGQYAPASPSKYVNAPLTSQSFASQGMSSSFSGSAQGSFSKPAPSSPTVSKFSSSRQVYSQSTSDQDLYGQLPAKSQFGSQPQKGTSPQLSQAASGFKSGHLMQSQGSLGQYAPASHGLDSQGMSSSFSGSAQGSFSKPAPSSPTVSKFSSSRQVYSQSTSDQDLYGQLPATSQFGSQPQKGTSPQLSPAASGFTSGSFPQSQGSLGQYAPASLSKYITAQLASQGFATRSATASSRRGLTSTFLGGSQSGSSLTLQGTGSSSMPQRTMSQFVSGSPSQHSSTSLSSTQSINGQYSPASQWVFSVSQSPQREPSVSSWTQGLPSSDAALSQGNLQFQSSRVHSRFSSQLSARDSANQSNPQALSKGSGQLVSSPGSSGSYSGISLQSPSTSSRYPLGSPGYVKLGSNLDSSQSGTGQSSSLYGSNLQTGSGAQHSSSSYASLQGGSSAVVGPSSQYGSVFSPLNAKSGLYLSRPSAASFTQGIQTSKTASSRSTSSAQMSSGFSSSLSALSQNVAPVAQSGPMSAVWRSQSPSRLSSSFQAPSASTIGGQMSERFTSHNAADSSLPSSSGLSAKLSSKVFSGSSLRKTAQTL